MGSRAGLDGCEKSRGNMFEKRRNPVTVFPFVLIFRSKKGVPSCAKFCHMTRLHVCGEHSVMAVTFDRFCHLFHIVFVLHK